MHSLPLSIFLVIALLLFAIGLFGALTKQNALMVLMSIALMMNAANLNFIAFAKYGIHPAFKGDVFVFLTIVMAVVEAIVGLAIIFSIYRSRSSDAKIRPFQGQKQMLGTTALVAISAILMVLVITKSYFQ